MREFQVNDPMALNSDVSNPNDAIHEDTGKIRDGSVFAYAADIQMGIIKTFDEHRFVFVRADWPHPEIAPRAGTIVTFEVAGPLARKIRIADSAPSPI